MDDLHSFTPSTSSSYYGDDMRYIHSPSSFLMYRNQFPNPNRSRGRRRQQEEDNASTAPNGDDPSNEARLRAALLENYDRNSYPWETMWEIHQEAGGERTGLVVEFNLNFHKVHALNVAESTAHLVVWVQMRWHDPRLSWDPTDFGGITRTWFWIENGMGGGEVSEIWTPDMYLWNQEESMDRTLADTYASVDPTGTVFWTRPGLIKSTCKFRGLGAFPFDSLKCTLEFGSWARSGLYIRPVKMGGLGYSIGGSETAGQSFAEFELKSVDSSEYVYPPYPSVPDEDWPVLLYNIECQRASRPYVRGWLLLQIMLNFCSFACMWIPPHVGERMGLAITALLASVASELTVSEQLPNSEEANWFIIFSLTSMAFSVAIVFQSTAVIYFYYFTGSSLKPPYVKWIQDKWAQRTKDKSNDGGKTTMNGTKQLQSNGDRMTFEASDKDLSSSMDAKNANSLDANPDGTNLIANTARRSGVVFDLPASLSEEEQSLQFRNIHNHALNASTSSPFHHRLDAEDFRDANEQQNNLRWQRVAKRLDDFSRLIIPAAYVVFLATILAKAGN
ncbi:neurotransmitter-gated ion-channel ligand binding domain containing protein [Nitzschia inconspicua]|uniref:Neurotransmitter-gated ion-channel ligand binding domain containing protein n=1 Tax=Nitzschia inconspicua TaxID=303405 RepID=A0A9K3L516_9STRA|nr:neurotransmitter-gated ion-channel ligand binding domain containing protein [Nitzschia inconspicua]